MKRALHSPTGVGIHHLLWTCKRWKSRRRKVCGNDGSSALTDSRRVGRPTDVEHRLSGHGARLAGAAKEVHL